MAHRILYRKAEIFGGSVPKLYCLESSGACAGWNGRPSDDIICRLDLRLDRRISSRIQNLTCFYFCDGIIIIHRTLLLRFHYYPHYFPVFWELFKTSENTEDTADQKKRQIRIGRKIAGTKFITLNFEICNIFNPNAIIIT